MADMQKLSDRPTHDAARETTAAAGRDGVPDLESQYRALLEVMAEGAMLLGANGRIQAVNPAAERMLGCRADEVVGTDAGFPLQFLNEDENPLPWELLPWTQTLHTGEPRSNAVMGLRRTDDTAVWIQANTQPIFDSGESVIRGVMTVFHEITRQHRPASAFLQDGAHTQSLFEAIPNPFFTKDRNGRYQACNAAFENYLGLSRDRIIGRTVYDISPKELADSYFAADQELFDHPGTQVYEARVCWADGSLRDVIFHKTTLVDADGRVLGLTGIIVDITERKRMEQALRLSERQYRTLVEHSPDLIVRYDSELRRTYVNPAWERASGLTAKEVVNVPAVDIPKETQPVGDEYQAALRRALQSASRQAVEFSWVNVRGETFYLQYVVVPECDHEGRVVSLLSVGRDVTEYKRAETALRESEARLRRLNRALRTLSAGNETLVRATSEQELLERMCRVMVDVGGHVLASIGDLSETNMLIEPRAWAGESDKDLRECACSTTCRALAEPRDRDAPLVVHDMTGNPICRECGARFHACGIRSVVILPLYSDSENLGVLSIYSTDLAAFDEDEVALLNELGKDLSYGIRALRNRLDREEGLRHIQATMEATIQALSNTVEFRDPYTAGHQRRVAQLARAIGREAGLSEDRINGLYLASVVHDIGKVRVPVEVLTRPGRLSELEFDLVKTHVEAGYDILKSIDFPWPIANIVRQHHERLDGTGYPLGIAGDDLVLESRILAVADVVEAVASFRPYRPALGVERALAEIDAGRDTLFDSDVVDICIRLFRENRFAFE